MNKTIEELNAENVKKEELFSANAIQKRKSLYPPIEEQLDMLWHGMNNNPLLKIEPFYSTLKAIKDSNPKQKDNLK